MKPQWRSPTVVAVCRRILDTREYDSLPILADALQDEGCTDSELMNQCLADDLDPILAERLVNLIYSEETAAAVRWLERFVLAINYSDEGPHTYQGIIAEGRRGIESGSMFFCTDDGADFFRQSPENRREFFRNWSLITGVPVADETCENMGFSCSC